MKTLRNYYDSLAMDIFNVIRSEEPRKIKEEKRDIFKSRLEKLDKMFNLEEKLLGKFSSAEDHLAGIHQSSETVEILMFQLNEQLETH